MAGQRFWTRANWERPSQFVPMPLDYIKGVVDEEQNKVDTFKSTLGAQGDLGLKYIQGFYDIKPNEKGENVKEWIETQDAIAARELEKENQQRLEKLRGVLKSPDTNLSDAVSQLEQYGDWRKDITKQTGVGGKINLAYEAAMKNADELSKIKDYDATDYETKKQYYLTEYGKEQQKQLAQGKTWKDLNYNYRGGTMAANVNAVEWINKALSNMNEDEVVIGDANAGRDYIVQTKEGRKVMSKERILDNILSSYDVSDELKNSLREQALLSGYRANKWDMSDEDRQLTNYINQQTNPYYMFKRDEKDNILQGTTQLMSGDVREELDDVLRGTIKDYDKLDSKTKQEYRNQYRNRKGVLYNDDYYAANDETILGNILNTAYKRANYKYMSDKDMKETQYKKTMSAGAAQKYLDATQPLIADVGTKTQKLNFTELLNNTSGAKKSIEQLKSASNEEGYKLFTDLGLEKVSRNVLNLPIVTNKEERDKFVTELDSMGEYLQPNGKINIEAYLKNNPNSVLKPLIEKGIVNTPNFNRIVDERNKTQQQIQNLEQNTYELEQHQMNMKDEYRKKNLHNYKGKYNYLINEKIAGVGNELKKLNINTSEDLVNYLISEGEEGKKQLETIVSQTLSKHISEQDKNSNRDDEQVNYYAIKLKNSIGNIYEDINNNIEEYYKDKPSNLVVERKVWADDKGTAIGKFNDEFTTQIAQDPKLFKSFTVAGGNKNIVDFLTKEQKIDLTEYDINKIKSNVQQTDYTGKGTSVLTIPSKKGDKEPIKIAVNMNIPQKKRYVNNIMNDVETTKMKYENGDYQSSNYNTLMNNYAENLGYLITNGAVSPAVLKTLQGKKEFTAYHEGTSIKYAVEPSDKSNTRFTVYRAGRNGYEPTAMNIGIEEVPNYVGKDYMNNPNNQVNTYGTKIGRNTKINKYIP